MSLLRLLTAGNCFVGQKDSVSRYRMTDSRALPKFGSGKNPFDGAPRTEAKPSMPTLPPGEPSSVSRDSLMTQTNPSACGQDTSAAHSPAPKLGGKVGDGVGKPSIWRFWATKRQSKSDDSKSSVPRGPGSGPAKTGSWISRLWGSLPGSSTRSQRQPLRPIVPHPVREPVQGELSLDTVRVVRNDLSDADLEVVPAKAPVAQPSICTIRQGGEKTAPTEAARERSGLRAAALWRIAGKNGATDTAAEPGTASLQAAGKT